MPKNAFSNITSTHSFLCPSSNLEIFPQHAVDGHTPLSLHRLFLLSKMTCLSSSSGTSTIFFPNLIESPNLCIYMYICMHICIDLAYDFITYMHICLYIHIHLYMYTYVYIHIHTYVHIYVNEVIFKAHDFYTILLNAKVFI